MAILVLAVLVLAMTGYSDASWCVCRSDVSESALQKALDYACGAGADCTPISQSGSCFQPNTVRAHCSYAVNSYYQKKGQTAQSCEFGGAATVTGTDPSASGCPYPSSGGSSSGTPTSPNTGGTPTSPNTGGTNTPTTIPPPGTGTGTGSGTGTGTGTGFTPNSPTTGIIGGGMGGTGLGPSGTGINTDNSDAGVVFQSSSSTTMLLLVTLWFSGLVFWWG